MQRTELGKISRVEFGFGGYQDAQIGLWLTFEGKGWGVSGSIYGGWSTSIKVSEYTKWTEEDRSRDYAVMVRRIDELLTKAKVMDISKLKGLPVELTFDGNMLKDWRILEEVL